LLHQLLRHIFTKIVFKPLRTNLFNIVLSAIFLTIGIHKTYSQELGAKKIAIPATKKVDTTSIPIVTVLTKDSVKDKKPFLEGKIKRKAVDYERINQKKKQITLYNKAELYYQDIELKSGIIILDYEKNEVYAGRIKDSTGKYTQLPVFTQGGNVVEPDSIRFNFKTKKALIWNSRTDQGEFKVKAEVSKRENDSVYFLKGARFTTAKDIEDPEYYFKTNKVKFVPGKKIVTGMTNMVIANVPTPLALPFAFFPMSVEAVSGLIIPTFNDTRAQGYSLQNGGYYFALGDKYDLAVLADYFTNGSYFNFRFENQITDERGFPNYAKTNIYNLQWSHSQDAKANPNSRFSASVNLGSSKYFKQSKNLINSSAILNNTLSSSVSYSKTFNSVPQVNMSLTATHSQNANTQEINMTLPTLQVSVDRIFPFAKDDAPKKGFIKNINLQYSLTGENRIKTTDSLFFKPKMFRDALAGFKHSIPLSTNFKVFKHFSISSSANYEEIWNLKTIRREYNKAQNKDITTEFNGFDAFRTYSFSSGIGTTVYGTFNFGEKHKIKSIRHVMKPNVSYSYTPSFEKYYDTYASDASGRMEIKQYSRFEGGIYGTPGLNKSNNFGFSLSNMFEAKVTDKDTTKLEPKKLMLLNNLNLSTSYNATSDSLRWAPLRLSAGTVLFKEKMNVNFGMTLNPYALNNAGNQINKFNIDNGGSLFRMTSANMTLNYSLSSKGNSDSKEKKEKQGLRNGGREDDLYGTSTDFSDRRESQFKEDEDEEDKFKGFYKSELPWDMTFAYQLTYGNERREKKITGNTVSISLNTDLTPKWKVGVNTGYDFVQNGVTYTGLRFERDLLSWRMDFNWTPFGENSTWGFFIGIKSGVLSDIKWEKNKPR
jgi:lipopolysaccharide assembly outer membrane protein LptD (OstA)